LYELHILALVNTLGIRN